VSQMNSPFLFGVAVLGLACCIIAIYYIIRVKSGFAALPRLERPWLLLELGVASLIVGALTVPWPGFSTSIAVLHLVQIVAVVMAAFFMLTAMVMMKQAWTIKEGE
jgi:hypothetical protein